MHRRSKFKTTSYLTNEFRNRHARYLRTLCLGQEFSESDCVEVGFVRDVVAANVHGHMDEVADCWEDEEWEDD